MLRTIIATTAICLAVSACGDQRPAIDPKLESGVTSSNGGGQRVLGSTPNISTGQNGVVTQRSNNTQGAAY